MDNANSPEYLEKIRNQVIENMRHIGHAPSVQMTDVPRDPEGMDDEADAMLDDLDEDENKDTRYTKRRWEKRVEKDGELSESEDEDNEEAYGVRRQPNATRRRNISDYPNAHAAPDDEDVAAAARLNRQTSLGASKADQGANGSGRSSASNADDSGASTPKSDNESPPPEDNTMQDEDVEMTDDPAPTTTNGGHQAADGPQEATPPASPLDATPAAPTVVETSNDLGGDAMDEGDTMEDPEAAEEGEPRHLGEDHIADSAPPVTPKS